jgi:hypothetical protein
MNKAKSASQAIELKMHLKPRNEEKPKTSAELSKPMQERKF